MAGPVNEYAQRKMAGNFASKRQRLAYVDNLRSGNVDCHRLGRGEVKMIVCKGLWKKGRWWVNRKWP